MSSAKKIYLLAELNWGDKRLSEFNGFEILRTLRFALRMLCPIIVCSFMPEDYFKPVRKNTGYLGQSRLFKGLSIPGQMFLSLPFKPSQLDKSLTALPLTNEQLNNVIDSLFDMDDIHKWIGTTSHSGRLVVSLEKLLNGIKGFSNGSMESIGGIPFNSVIALEKTWRELILTIKFLDKYSLLNTLSQHEAETLKSCLDRNSVVSNAFQRFIDSAANIEQRIKVLTEYDSSNLIKCLTLIITALHKSKKD